MPKSEPISETVLRSQQQRNKFNWNNIRFGAYHNLFLIHIHKKNTECDTHKFVIAQMLRTVRGWFWLILDGRWQRICEASAFVARPTPQIWTVNIVWRSSRTIGLTTITVKSITSNANHSYATDIGRTATPFDARPVKFIETKQTQITYFLTALLANSQMRNGVVQPNDLLRVEFARRTKTKPVKHSNLVINDSKFLISSAINMMKIEYKWWFCSTSIKHVRNIMCIANAKTKTKNR